MKFQLNNSLEVIAKGEALEGEYVYDPDGKHKLADLKAVAVANAIAFTSTIQHSFHTDSRPFNSFWRCFFHIAMLPE